MKPNKVFDDNFPTKSTDQEISNKLKKHSLNEKDPFSDNCSVFSGNSSGDVSINHDEYLYGDNK